jgi:hypothetical protein
LRGQRGGKVSGVIQSDQDKMVDFVTCCCSLRQQAYINYCTVLDVTKADVGKLNMTSLSCKTVLDSSDIISSINSMAGFMKIKKRVVLL